MVAVLAFSGAGALTDSGVVSAVHENSDSPAWVHETNFTIQPTNPVPGEKTGVAVWASFPQTDAYGDGLGAGHFVKAWAPQAFSKGISSVEDSACSREDVKVAGIDRGSNLSGTKVDESLVSNVKNYWISQNEKGQTTAMVEAYQKDDMGGEHVSAHYSDQAIVVIDDCYTMPEQTGWFRGGVYGNGTNYEDEYIELAGYTYYMYNCDCENREEAIEKLGPPPVEGKGFEGSVIRADSEGVFGDRLEGGAPTDWDLQELREPDASEDTGTEPTATEAPGGAAGGDGSAATPTPTGAPDTPATDGGDEPTSTPASQETDANSDPATMADGSENDSGGGENGQTTPTTSEGPGLGPLLALVGLLASTLLLYRRR